MPATMVDVRTILAGTFDDVDRVATSPAVTRALLDDLRNAEKLLAAKLRKEAQKFGSLDSRFTGSAALAYQQQVQQSIEYVQHRLRGHTKDAARAACEQGVNQAATLLEGLEQRFGGVTIPIRLRQSAQLRHDVATNAGGVWARQFPTSVDRYGAHMMGQFEETIRAGMLAGSTMDEMIAAFTGHGGPTGAVSMSAKVTPTGVLRVVEEDIPEGLFVRHKYWAERIVRTEVIRAYNGAKHEGMVEMSAQFPDMQRKILAILDKRTAADSIAVHGQIRDMKTPFTDGAGRVYMYPPARPNDRETVIPWRPHWNDSADNMSVWEKACCGELDDPAVEAKLAKAMEQIAKGNRKAPGVASKSPRGPRPPKPPPAPMAMPSLPTPAQRREATYRGLVSTDVARNHVFVDGIGYGYASGKPGKYVALKFDDPRSLSSTTSAVSATIHKTIDDALKDVARDANRQMAIAAGAQQHEAWDKDKWAAAAVAGDATASRRLVRGVLDDAGVVSRDALFVPGALSQTKMVPDSAMPDAYASHGWDGVLQIRDSQMRLGNHQSFSTFIHEELHGATRFRSTGFYQGYGATVEEVTVEMAARKLTDKTFGKSTMGEFGSYQLEINRMASIVGAEARLVRAEALDALADAGIAMRSATAASTAAVVDTPDGILDAFLGALKVPATTKATIRSRIKAEISAPR